MSGPLLLQARKVVRLRDIRFDAAVEAFENALSAVRQAEAGLADAATAARDASAALLSARHALPADPGRAQTHLARIDAAAAHLVACEDWHEVAKRTLAEAEHALAQARTEMLRARARRDAMSKRAGFIASDMARQQEEAAAIEGEERMLSRAGED